MSTSHQRLIVAEKPELGRAIADALGNGRAGRGHIRCGDDVVTWCFGHLLELTDPEDHDPADSEWRFDRLPLRWPVKHKPIADKREQLDLIRKLVAGAGIVIHAGDPDSEGQLLVETVLRHVGNQAPVQRLLINDLNPALVRRALANLKDNNDFQGLYRSALARSAADQRYGYTLTRGYTLAARKAGSEIGVLSVGRVQTPILGLVVRRDRAHESHEKQAYFELEARLKGNNGKLDAKYLPNPEVPVDERGRVIDRVELERIAQQIDGATGTVSKASTKEKRTPPPLPYDLLSLQADVSRKFGLAPDRTLAITQSLRERHKLITYNRSDCRYLSEEQHPESPAVLAAIAATAPTFNRAVAAGDTSIKSRAFDSRHVTAHHAIVPTARHGSVASLSTDEARIYQLIARAFIAQFHVPERFRATRVEVIVEGHCFAATGRVTVDPGWKRLYRHDKVNSATSKDDELERDLEWIETGMKLRCTRSRVIDKETKPPPYYTMSSLLEDLARVSKYVKDPRIRALLIEKDSEKKGEHGGIGTPATRSAIIAQLIKRGYIDETGKRVMSTPIGRAFHDTLPARATEPDMTALWHEQQKQIERGETSIQAFLTGVGDYLREEIDRIGREGVRIAESSAPPCTACGKGRLITRKGPKGLFRGCSQYPDCRATADHEGAAFVLAAAGK